MGFVWMNIRLKLMKINMVTYHLRRLKIDTSPTLIV